MPPAMQHLPVRFGDGTRRRRSPASRDKARQVTTMPRAMGRGPGVKHETRKSQGTASAGLTPAAAAAEPRTKMAFDN